MVKTSDLGPGQFSLFDILDARPIDALLTPEQIYTTDDPALFQRLGENPHFDRKSGKISPRDLAPLLSAFGNGPSVSGGVVAIGIANDGSMEGLNKYGPDHISELENLGSERCPFGRFLTRRLPVRNAKGDEDFILLAKIDYVEDRLVELTNHEAYIRRGNKSILLNDVEKNEVRINKGELSFEQQSSQLAWPDDYREKDVTKFLRNLRKLLEINPETSDEQILEMSRLGRRRPTGFLPNHAATLLFAIDPRREFPGAYIHCLRYDGEEEKSGAEFNVVKERIVEGSILDQISGAAHFLSGQLREFTNRRDGKFYALPEYPEDAWYELLVNAVAHRSYHIRTAPIFIKMFNNRLVVESPGSFMPQVNSETIYEMHRPRNPFLMAALREFGEARCINEGTKRVRKEMADARLPAPDFT
jgi:ATP-dependent DNA helicase RecG